jgi:hypothetical protein
MGDAGGGVLGVGKDEATKAATAAAVAEEGEEKENDNGMDDGIGDKGSSRSSHNDGRGQKNEKHDTIIKRHIPSRRRGRKIESNGNCNRKVDMLCLQELDLPELIDPFLSNLGYDRVETANVDCTTVPSLSEGKGRSCAVGTSDRVDRCAIYWRRDRFDLVSSELVRCDDLADGRIAKRCGRIGDNDGVVHDDNCDKNSNGNGNSNINCNDGLDGNVKAATPSASEVAKSNEDHCKFANQRKTNNANKNLKFGSHISCYLEFFQI